MNHVTPLARFRVNRGLSQEDVASRLSGPRGGGVLKSTMARIESGERVPTVRMVVKLARFYSSRPVVESGQRIAVSPIDVIEAWCGGAESRARHLSRNLRRRFEFSAVAQEERA